MKTALNLILIINILTTISNLGVETIYENQRTGEKVEVYDKIDRKVIINDTDFQEVKFFANEINRKEGANFPSREITEAYTAFYFEHVSYENGSGVIDYLWGGPNAAELSGISEVGFHTTPIVPDLVGGSGKSAVKPIARQVSRHLVQIQKHHIIPKAIWKKYKSLLKPFLEINGGFNLKKLPTPFHGNHPQYNAYVGNQIEALIQNGNLNTQSLKQLQKQLNT